MTQNHGESSQVQENDFGESWQRLRKRQREGEVNDLMAEMARLEEEGVTWPRLVVSNIIHCFPYVYIYIILPLINH